MLEYAVCEIGGRQYLIKPNQVVEVDRLKAEGKIVIDKVLLTGENGQIKIGKPYLDMGLNFEVLGEVRKPKIRVATYKAKANYRRVKGARTLVSRIKLETSEGEKPKKTKKIVKKT